MKTLFTSIIFLSLLTATLYAGFFDDDVEEDEVTISKELYLKYINFPKQIYTQQRFSVKLEAIVLTSEDKFDKIVTTYSDEKNIDLLDSNITWKKLNQNTYTTKISYKSRKDKLVLPVLKLALYKDDEEVNSIKINPPKIKYNNIAINQERFSNIIATNLDIKSVKTKQYNNSMLMVVTNISTTNGNLEEFHLNKFKEQKIQSFEESNTNQNMYYYTIIPNHIESIKFDYYNPQIQKFITVELPIILDDELVSTQTELNPNNTNILLYKQLAIFFVFFVFLLIYLKTKNKFFILLSVLPFLVFVKLIIPNSKVYLNENTKVYILPTKSSTVYKTLENKEEVEILIKQKDFIKVLFKNNNIGWIRKNNVS